MRTGNVTTAAISGLLRVSRSRIEAFDAATEESLLVLPLMVSDEAEWTEGIGAVDDGVG